MMYVKDLKEATTHRLMVGCMNGHSVVPEEYRSDTIADRVYKVVGIHIMNRDTLLISIIGGTGDEYQGYTPRERG